MVVERIVTDCGRGVVFDPGLTPGLEPRWFEADYWHDQQAARHLDGGRGGVFVVDTPAGQAVLRHYRRGGSVARLLGDRFLWRGQERVRSLREFRLLRYLHGLDLPVPRPLGGAWCRAGLYYRADLMTLRVCNAASLASVLDTVQADTDIAAAIGHCVGRLHFHGGFHADLNAHNILVGEAGRITLIDFDRGRILAPQPRWQQSNLRRLHRSLVKVSGHDGQPPAWLSSWWHALIRAHSEASSTP